MQSYVRMRAKPKALAPVLSKAATGATPGTTEVMFEVVAYPHFVEGDDTCKCFFATAKAYPSRNVAL